MFQVTHIDHHITYIAVLARKGCRKVNFYAMPATGRELDQRVPLREVPLFIRQAARTFLL